MIGVPTKIFQIVWLERHNIDFAHFLVDNATDTNTSALNTGTKISSPNAQSTPANVCRALSRCAAAEDGGAGARPRLEVSRLHWRSDRLAGRSPSTSPLLTHPPAHSGINSYQVRYVGCSNVKVKGGWRLLLAPESVFLDEGYRAGVGVNFFADFSTNKKAAHH